MEGLVILGILLLIVIGIFLLVFWICMMVSALRNKEISETTRWVWFGLMLGLEFLYGIGFIVAIVYYFTDRRKIFKQ